MTLQEPQRNHVTLRVNSDDDLPLVQGDRFDLRQVILDSIPSAAEPMHGLADRPWELMISTIRDGSDHIRLAVKDVGIGFDASSVEKLFNPFYMTKSGGMGIGLSVSRSIIETHRGRFWAEANDGPGAMVSFSLPCYPEDGADAGCPSHAPAPGTAGPREPL
jgi:signal transduction histidine kinase